MPLTSQELLDGTIAARFHDLTRKRLRLLLTRDLVAEHERQPLGQHTDALRRVLTYLGSFPIQGKLIVEHDGHERWYVCRLSHTDRLRAQRIEGPLDTEGAAVHAVFLRRLRAVFGEVPA
ncbi:MAG: hypothetical protein QOI36_3114 [Pseudonocardiales bacterium]|jgi:branched-chain amino acid transport system permease protein|nr:hypothetical protein [Pseudonocardiales bacterium]